jgi:DNA-binding transcriptional LysR family regulator
MTRRLPSLNALRAFEAAGRLGLMKLAADELHVTHSAISRQIQHLEVILDLKLFEGPKHAPKLTDAGRTLLPGLSAGLDQIDLAVRLVADSDEGPVDVSCLGTFMMKWLTPRLHRFRQLFPSLEVRLSTSDTPVDFSRDNFDVAVRVGEGPWPADTDVVPLFVELFGPVYSASLAVDRDGIWNLPMLRTLTRRSAWEDWCERAGVTTDTARATEFEHFYFMIEAAVGGLGMCIAPWPLVADDIAAGRLIAPFGFIESGQTYVALRRQRRNKKSSIFCKWLQQAAAEFILKQPPLGIHLAALSGVASSISLPSK